MAEANVREKRDLELFENEYAFMQDVTKGNIKVYSGPAIVNPAAQETPVKYNPETKKFERCNDMESARQFKPIAVEGFYCVLTNPAVDRKHPGSGLSPSVDLEVGRKIVIPGPAMFSLWPGQEAEVIRGHHLRSNQYLLVRVYNEDEAKKNWSKAVVKPAAPTPIDTTGLTPEQIKKAQAEADEKAKAQLSKATPPPDLTVGKLLIIKGTEVSFYIPPTGITVVQDGVDGTGKSIFVREALTLERLEYAILIDESGDKRYDKGPNVVFPKPTERFMEARDEGQVTRKFRAIELNELQGIHIKVIADYEEKGTQHKTGEELFITGKDTAIYYPREEHSAIKYDGKTKHFATAIPVGEARYVLNRLTGVIKKVQGPAMLLPDPRSEVIVRRVLTDKQVELMYPGNAEALQYNRDLRQIQEQVPSVRGAPSEGDVERGTKALRSRGIGETKTAGLIASASVNYMSAIADSSRVSKDQGFVGEEFVRSANYTQPRTLTLNTKYQGAPTIEVWTGYAVLVVSKSGTRRVVQGPGTVLLDYDESLEALDLSTGKPKNTDKLLHTAYLRTENNQVTDIIRGETSDHVQVEMKLSYWVNFEGEELKWFSVENYVKFLCDHIRSVLKGFIKKITIKEFYANSTDLLRGWILGKDHTGMKFDSNGMVVTDVEVLSVLIADESIRNLLDRSQTEVVRTDIELATLRRGLEVVEEKEHISRQSEEARAETTKLKNQLETELAASALAVTLAKLGNQLQTVAKEKEARAAAEELSDFTHNANLVRQRKTNEQQLELAQIAQTQAIELLKIEAETIVQRFQAASGGFTEALLALTNNETMVKVAEAWSLQKVVGGDSVSDALAKVFQGTPLAGLMNRMTSGPMTVNGTTDKKVSTGAQS